MKIKEKRKYIKLLIWNSVFLLIGVTSIELIFGSWFGGNYLMGLNVLHSIQRKFSVCDLYDRNPCEITYTRDRYGLRGAPANPGRIDLLVVGGSTTDQRFIDDRETWDQGLEDRLKDIVVANGGADGQSTVGHIANFRQWYPEVPGLAPRWILFYIGINDLYVSADFDRDHDKARPRRIWERSAVYHLFRTLRGYWRARRAELIHQKRSFGSIDFEHTLSSSEIEAIVEPKKSGLQKRILQLVELSRRMGAHPIFVTQTRRHVRRAGRLGAPSGTLSISQKSYKYIDALLMQLELNKAILGTCQRQSLTCIDLAGELNFEVGDFYDDAHNTPAGAARIADYLAKKLPEAIVEIVPK